MRKASTSLKGQVGFTLIEIILALSILGVMMGTTYSSLSQMMKAKSVLDDERDTRLIASAILGRLTRELQSAANDIALLPPRSDPTQRYSAKNNLIGEPKELLNGERGDTITFMALEAGQYLPDGGGHSGVVQLSYRAAEDPDLKYDEQTPYILVRDETPNIRPYEKAFEKIMTFPISKSLAGLAFEYYDIESSEWTTSWGQANKVGLPGLIRFTVKIRSPRGKTTTFTSIVPLRLP